MLHKRALSFGYALSGLKVAWREEVHFKMHVFAASVALIASWYFQITRTEFFVVLIMIGVVTCAELLNTALEELADKFSPTHDPHIGKIKDLAAAAVFVTSVIAFVLGCIIFGPYALEII